MLRLYLHGKVPGTAICLHWSDYQYCGMLGLNGSTEINVKHVCCNSKMLLLLIWAQSRIGLDRNLFGIANVIGFFWIAFSGDYDWIQFEAPVYRFLF